MHVGFEGWEQEEAMRRSERAMSLSKSDTNQFVGAVHSSYEGSAVCVRDELTDQDFVRSSISTPTMIVIACNGPLLDIRIAATGQRFLVLN